MSNPELCLQLRMLLEHEPTRSLPLDALHDRVRARLGPRSPTLPELCRELARDGAFVVLERTLPETLAALCDELPAGYAPALREAGLGSAARVVLAPGPAAPAEPAPLALASDALRMLAEAAPEARAAVAEAFHQLASISPDAYAALSAPAAPSTTPPPPAPAPRRSRRRWRSPA